MLAQNVTSVGMGRRNAFLLCLCSRNCVIIIIIIFLEYLKRCYILCILHITITVFVVVVVMFQNRQLIVTSLGYCWYSGAPSKVPIVGVLATSGGRWVWEKMECDSDIVIYLLAC